MEVGTVMRWCMQIFVNTNASKKILLDVVPEILTNQFVAQGPRQDGRWQCFDMYDKMGDGKVLRERKFWTRRRERGAHDGRCCFPEESKRRRNTWNRNKANRCGNHMNKSRRKERRRDPAVT